MSSKRLSKEDIDRFFEYGVHPGTRTVYIGSAVYNGDDETGTDFLMAEKAIKGLHILDSQSAQDITVLMNNLGGDEYHGLAIFDAIRACRSRVTVRGTGHVMSMGSWIIQAADWRVMTPSAVMMIHYGEFGVLNHPKITYKWAEEGKRLDRLMEDTYLDRIRVRHPKFTRKRLQEMLNFDTILTAQQALELGLIDKIEQCQEGNE